MGDLNLSRTNILEGEGSTEREREREGMVLIMVNHSWGGGGGFHTLTEHKYEKFEKKYPGRTHILGQHVPIDFCDRFITQSLLLLKIGFGGNQVRMQHVLCV